MSYKQKRADYERLRDIYKGMEPHDFCGFSCETSDFFTLLEDPTKATAAYLYGMYISAYFYRGADIARHIDRREVPNDDISMIDAEAYEIYVRNGFIKGDT